MQRQGQCLTLIVEKFAQGQISPKAQLLHCLEAFSLNSCVAFPDVPGFGPAFALPFGLA